MALLELKALRRGDDHLKVGQLAGDRQRAGDVVAVAQVGEARPLQSPSRSRIVIRSASAWQGW